MPVELQPCRKLGAGQQVHCIPQNHDSEMENTSMIGEESTHSPASQEAPGPQIQMRGTSCPCRTVNWERGSEDTVSPEPEASAGSEDGQEEQLLTSHSPEPRSPRSTVLSSTR